MTVVTCIALMLAIAPGARAQAAPDGAKLFAEHCSTCHDATGAGVPSFGPPLAGPIAARVKAGARDYLAEVVVNGITGTFELAGQKQLGIMPSFAALSDDELAAALNHVVFTLNAQGVGEGAVRFTGRDIARARATPRTPGELDRKRQALVRAGQ